MTGPSTGSPSTDGAVPRGPWRRLWLLPLWVHVLALATVLVAIVPIADRGVFSSDEGAALAQAHSLASGDGWIVEHPVPGLDDDADRYYPLELSQRGEKGVAPFARHALYAAALGAAYAIGGETSAVLLSVLGALAAAAVAGLLGGALAPSLARPALWLVGLGSPLFFDAYIVIAHTVGAAAAGFAFLLALRAVRGTGPRTLLYGATAAAIVVVGVNLRAEFLVFAGALGASVLVGAVLQWIPRATGAAVGLCVLAAGVAGYLVQTRALLAIVGATRAGEWEPSPRTGLVSDRLYALYNLFFDPGGVETDLTRVSLVCGTVFLVAAAIRIRRPPSDGSLPRVLAIAGTVAIGLGAIGMLGGDLASVDSLVIAFPVGAALVALIGRDTLRRTEVRLMVLVSTLFAVGVIAASHSVAGGAEWGGRYLAIVLPIAVPALLWAWRVRSQPLDERTRNTLAACGVITCSVMAVVAVGVLRETHDLHTAAVADVRQAVDDLVPGVDSPVVVAVQGAYPRVAWSLLNDYRWLLLDEPDGTDLAFRLRRAGVDEFVLVARNGEPPPDFGADVSVTPWDVESAAGDHYLVVLRPA